MNVTPWLLWFLRSLKNALNTTDTILSKVLTKADFWRRHSQTGLNERQRFMLNKLMGTPKNCFFGVRLQFLNPHLQLVNSGLKILSALKNRVFRSSLMDDFTGKLTAVKWAKMNKISRDTALRDIQDLINKEILQKEQAGGRSTNYELIILKK